MDDRFSEVITSEEQLRAVMGNPSQLVLKKQIAALDGHCRAFIAQCPFLLIATCDAEGRMDISPKGDPPGFVQVLDDTTLAIPDRPGNRRADTFRNILQNPRVGLIFLIPGKRETLRVNGRAMLVRDQWLRDAMAVEGKTPDFALVVTVEEAFFHCAKCMLRSHLWDGADTSALDTLPTLAQVLVDAAKPDISVAELQERIEQDVRERLY